MPLVGRLASGSTTPGIRDTRRSPHAPSPPPRRWHKRGPSQHVCLAGADYHLPQRTSIQRCLAPFLLCSRGRLCWQCCVPHRARASSSSLARATRSSGRAPESSWMPYAARGNLPIGSPAATRKGGSGSVPCLVEHRDGSCGTVWYRKGRATRRDKKVRRAWTSYACSPVSPMHAALQASHAQRDHHRYDLESALRRRHRPDRAGPLHR